ncbi:hypothetical protein ABT160_15270 [Streptomyces sp. NPDC001941]|uniref:hypothetical protein n=1 Tax=Streptomyces sp. NPDC001941 TaxID=3154659 RepID=UPI0033335EF1
MPTERTPAARTAAPLLAALLAAGLLGACEKAPAEPVTATGTLEQLAATAGCAPDVQTDAKELRQAKCKTEQGSWVIATFETDRGQREWLNQAKDYGGSYLVGRRWVAAGAADVVAGLRGRLGGTVETSAPHGRGSVGGAGHEGH